MKSQSSVQDIPHISESTLALFPGNFDLPEYPTLLDQIVTLAAGLSRTANEPAAEIAKRALALWRECRAAAIYAQIEAHKHGAAFLKELPRYEAMDAEVKGLEEQIETPERFPVPAVKLPGLAVPKLRGRTYEANHALRLWLWRGELGRRAIQTRDRATRERIWQSEYDKPTVDALFAEWSKRTLGPTEFQEKAEAFAHWYDHHHAREVSAAKRRGPQKRWLKQDVEGLLKLPAHELQAAIEGVATRRHTTPEEVRKALEKARTGRNRKKL